MAFSFFMIVLILFYKERAMNRFFYTFILIMVSSLVFAGPVKENQTANQNSNQQIIAKFIDGGRLFENEYYVTFKPLKGAAITFNVTFPDEKITDLKLFTDKKGILVPSSKMKNKNFIIQYTKKDMEDENTGEPVTRYFIDSIKLKK